MNVVKLRAVRHSDASIVFLHARIR